MNLHDIFKSAHDNHDDKLAWDADNSWFVCGILIPNLKLSDDDKQIMMWAYGQPPITHSYEQISDGETVVKDMFLNGLIKSPAGVSHDFINRIPLHTTPDGHKWTAWQANTLYRRIMKALGYSFITRWDRWIGVTISKRVWWR